MKDLISKGPSSTVELLLVNPEPLPRQLAGVCTFPRVPTPLQE
eukprot:COSAG05_NODE_11719_length_500_cov_0.890274_1_plen_42_part_10